MYSVHTSLIEGFWSTIYLFMMAFNPYNIYVVLYGTLFYGNSSIFPNLGNSLGAFLPILVFFNLLSRTSTSLRTL